jgi:hypothetical protein
MEKGQKIMSRIWSPGRASYDIDTDTDGREAQEVRMTFAWSWARVVYVDA